MLRRIAIIRMDADSTRGKDAHKKLLEQVDAADCAVLLGTQMIAKGLDFPEVTLVGVVNADFALKLPDFRAGERAYDLLEQVAGRAGRGDRPGEVIMRPTCPRIRSFAPSLSTTVRSLPTTTWISAATRCTPPFYSPGQHFWCGRRTETTRTTTSGALQSFLSAAGMPPRQTFFRAGSAVRVYRARLHV